MKVLEIKEYKILMDDDDFARLNGKGVWLQKSRSDYYARTYINRKMQNIPLVRFILDVPVGMQVDHINKNTLDNRKDNLRICTATENVRHRRMQKNNKSGLKGVHWIPSKKTPWRSQIKFDNKLITIGRFKTKEDAHNAYMETSRELFGDFV